ncbi:MAG: DUF2283 domain-containing protein [Actinomycetota bacterium]
MAVYTYDAEADVLYVLLVEDSEAAIQRTEELGPNLHVDLDDDGTIVGVEFLYPRTHGLDVGPVKDRFDIDLEIPFSFAA